MRACSSSTVAEMLLPLAVLLGFGAICFGLGARLMARRFA
jgi:hypothetical protein